MKEQLESILGKGRVVENKNISPYLTLRTQTSAQYYFEANSREDLLKVGELKAKGTPVFILGGGSNLAIVKNRLEGLVVHNRYQKKEILSENDKEVELLVSSGYMTGRLVKETTSSGYAGFENHLGLPGTIGGAIYMNSKWTKPVSYCGDNLIWANVVDTHGNIKKVYKDYFQFAYDYSILQKTNEILVEAVFRLPKADPVRLQQKAKEALEYRRATQPFGVATSGCFFQNIEGESAGQLIDQAGLKNHRVGDFIVSDKHANFIINTGAGKAADLTQIIQDIKSTVKQKYGVELKEEVIVI